MSNKTDNSEFQIMRVELRYENDTQYMKKTLIGEEAEKWLKAVGAEAVFASVHGWNFPELNWNIETGPKQ